MKLSLKILGLASLLLTSQVFADTDTLSAAAKGITAPDSCKKIAIACKKAGYSDSGFWFDCMKPLILGKAVKDITISSDDSKTCKEFKIKMLKEELQEFEQS